MNLMNRSFIHNQERLVLPHQQHSQLCSQEQHGVNGVILAVNRPSSANPFADRVIYLLDG